MSLNWVVFSALGLSTKRLAVVAARRKRLSKFETEDEDITFILQREKEICKVHPLSALFLEFCLETGWNLQTTERRIKIMEDKADKG